MEAHVTTDAKVADQVRGILESIEDDRVVLHLPHTDYRLRLVVDDAAPLRERVGKRVRGRIRGRALRIHATAGGGRFIEPIIGEPRIVTGTLRALDPVNHRVLVDVAAPMWLATESGQDYGVFSVGGLVTCYVESGTRFVPDGVEP